MSDMRLLSVGPMSEFREPKIKACKVYIKMLLKNVCGGPPNANRNQHNFLCASVKRTKGEKSNICTPGGGNMTSENGEK